MFPDGFVQGFILVTINTKAGILQIRTRPFFRASGPPRQGAFDTPPTALIRLSFLSLLMRWTSSI